MCGILGCSRLTDSTYRLMHFLGFCMEDRGKDSWGITNGTDHIRRIGPLSQSWYEELPHWDAWPWAIAHTRAASTGAVSIPNQHPFLVEHEGRKIVGIHNGVVPNHEDLNKRHNRNFECDSPHIFCALAGMSPTQEVQGYGNLAWFEFEPGEDIPKLWFLRFNSDNLHIARLITGEIVFASTREPIERGAKMVGTAVEKFFQLDGDTKYFVDLDSEDPTKDQLYKGAHTTFGIRYGSYSGDTAWDLAHGVNNTSRHNNGRSYFPRRPVPVLRGVNSSSYGASSSSSSSEHASPGTARENNYCAKLYCKNKVQDSRRKQILCTSCMVKIIDGIELPSDNSPTLDEMGLGY